MTEAQLRDTTIPARTHEDWLLRVMVLEFDRRQCVLRGLVDSRPNEPWRICSPEDFRAGKARMLERAAKPEETARRTAERIEADQFQAGKKGGR